MTNFKYAAKDPAGRPSKARSRPSDKTEAVAELRRQNLVVDAGRRGRQRKLAAKRQAGRRRQRPLQGAAPKTKQERARHLHAPALDDGRRRSRAARVASTCSASRPTSPGMKADLRSARERAARRLGPLRARWRPARRSSTRSTSAWCARAKPRARWTSSWSASPTTMRPAQALHARDPLGDDLPGDLDGARARHHGLPDARRRARLPPGVRRRSARELPAITTFVLGRLRVHEGATGCSGVRRPASARSSAFVHLQARPRPAALLRPLRRCKRADLRPARAQGRAGALLAHVRDADPLGRADHGHARHRRRDRGQPRRRRGRATPRARACATGNLLSEPLAQSQGLPADGRAHDRDRRAHRRARSAAGKDRRVLRQPGQGRDQVADQPDRAAPDLASWASSSAASCSSVFLPILDVVGKLSGC